MSVTKDVFKEWANNLWKRVMDLNEVEHGVWTVLAPFCSIEFLAYIQYVPGDGAAETNHVQGLQKIDLVLSNVQSRFTVILYNEPYSRTTGMG